MLACSGSVPECLPGQAPQAGVLAGSRSMLSVLPWQAVGIVSGDRGGACMQAPRAAGRWTQEELAAGLVGWCPDIVWSQYVGGLSTACLLLLLRERCSTECMVGVDELSHCAAWDMVGTVNSCMLPRHACACRQQAGWPCQQRRDNRTSFGHWMLRHRAALLLLSCRARPAAALWLGRGAGLCMLHLTHSLA